MGKQISSMYVSLTGNISGLAKSFNSAVAPVSNFRTQMKAAGGGFAEMSGGLLKTIGIGAAFGAGMAVVSSALGGITDAFARAAKKEENALIFEGLLGSAARAKVVLGDIRKYALATNFDSPSVAAATKKLLAFGITAGDLPEMLKRIGDVAAGVGAPIEEVAAVYGKMAAKGKAESRQLRELASAGVPIVAELARQFGVANDQVGGLVDSGVIGFPQVKKAFEDMTNAGGRFENMAQRQGNTIGGLWNRLVGTIKAAAGDVTTKVIDAFGLKKALAFLVSGVQRVGPLIQSGLGASQPYIDGFKNAVEASFQAVYGAIKPILDQIGGAIQGAFSFYVGYVDTVYGSLVRVVITNWQAILTNTVSYGLAIVDFLSGALSMISDIVSTTWQAVVTVWDAANTFLIGSTRTSAEATTSIWQGVVDACLWMRDKVSDALTLLGYSMKHWRDVVDIAGLSVALSVVQMGNQIEYVFTEVVPKTIIWMANNWRDILTSMADFTVVVFKNLTSNIGRVLGSLPDLIKGNVTFGDLWQPLTTGFESSLKELPQIAARQAGPLEQSLQDQLSAKSGSFIDGLFEHVNAQHSKADTLAKSIAGAFSNAFNAPPKLPTPEMPKLPTLTYDAELSEDSKHPTIAPEIKMPKAILAGSAEAQLARYLNPRSVAPKAPPAPKPAVASASPKPQPAPPAAPPPVVKPPAVAAAPKSNYGLNGRAELTDANRREDGTYAVKSASTGIKAVLDEQMKQNLSKALDDAQAMAKGKDPFSEWKKNRSTTSTPDAYAEWKKNQKPEGPSAFDKWKAAQPAAPVANAAAPKMPETAAVTAPKAPASPAPTPPAAKAAPTAKATPAPVPQAVPSKAMKDVASEILSKQFAEMQKQTLLLTSLDKKTGNTKVASI